MRELFRFIFRRLTSHQNTVQQINRRRAELANACDLTYGTATEIRFDYLGDQLALQTSDQVHRPFNVAVVDEADSILIDEARLPLVIAGEDAESESLAHRVDALTRQLQRSVHY